MRLFQCERCGQLVYFDNTHCVRCGAALGFHPASMQVSSLEPAGDGRWIPAVDSSSKVRFCANAQRQACNWLVPADGEKAFCIACDLNRIVPNLGDPAQNASWIQLEQAKRRLVYTLLRLGLPVRSKVEDGELGLAFEFLSDLGVSDSPIFTGHSDGVITINIDEADPVKRERRRSSLAEPYRTLLGHFRHEIGHYYWDLLVRDRPPLEGFRKLFGDERADYSAALDAYHAGGPPADWGSRFVTAYSSSHPWEDWAETWAHYLHIMDSLETAHAFGLNVAPKVPQRTDAVSIIDPFEERRFDRIIETWLPLTNAVNSLNRSMGQPDLYPFVLTAAAIDKLRFIHKLIRSRSENQRPSAAAISAANSSAIAPPRSSGPSSASRSK